MPTPASAGEGMPPGASSTCSLTYLLAYSPTRLLVYSPSTLWGGWWPTGGRVAGTLAPGPPGVASEPLVFSRLAETSTHGLPRARRRPAPASEPDGQATCIPNALAEKPARPDLVGPYELLRTARDQVVPAGNSSEPKARGHWRRTPLVRPSAVCPTPPPVLVPLPYRHLVARQRGSRPPPAPIPVRTA